MPFSIRGLRAAGLAGLSACALLLAGCAVKPELQPQSAASVAPNQALIFSPIGGPAMLGVVQTVYPNATKQEIALATNARSPGQNKISVIVFAGKGGDGGDAAIKDVPFTAINLTEEALAAWPGSGMAVSPYYVQNDYGPFGYAIGKPANGDTCIYAWQRIEPALKPSGAIARGAVVIRLQLCDRDRNEQSLLGVMYQLRLNAPLFDPWQAPSQIGRLAVPIVPQGAAGFVEVIKSAPAPVRRPAAAATAPVVQQPVVFTPPPGAPIVPLPGGSTVSGGPIVPLPTGAAGTRKPTVIVPKPPRSSQ